MSSLSASRRSRRSAAIGILSLPALVSVMSSPWVLREWHAWQGHNLFIEKKFVEASSHLVHVGAARTLVADYFKMPPMKHLYAQSLLVAGRNGEAIQQYSELADLDPGDATLALIIALHDGTRSNWQSAVARLERHKTSATCQVCKDAHSVFRSAMLAQPKVLLVQREQDAYLAKMKLPAQCVLYRGGSATAGFLLPRVVGFLEAGMSKVFAMSGMSRQAIRTANSIARPLIRKAVNESIESVAQLADLLQTKCVQKVQMHEVLRLKDIPIVGAVDGWVSFKTLEDLGQQYFFVGEAKEVVAAAPHLYELGALAVAYAKAYKVESDARALVREAYAYSNSRWDTVKIAAQDPEFGRKGVSPIPNEKSWLETIKPYVWPF